MEQSKEKTCCFFGHRDSPFRLREQLKLAVRVMIVTGVAERFYVGNHGNFDKMAYGVLCELQKEYPHIRYYVVPAYALNDRMRTIYGDHVAYPDDRTEEIDPKFAIYDRNDWIIRQSRYVICYLARSYGGASHFVRKAEKNGLIVLNLKC
ncbi:MAG: hypothetical protein IIY93_13025 [Clostridia bacterium]|nr:hypothetical protein [Clostridia bacterium]MBQ1553841.1 hypothetical protein [Clostridia bacterium]MBQ4397197.1 hypothetical protein [Clostridia bacterium]